jgi:hypothetical protein
MKFIFSAVILLSVFAQAQDSTWVSKNRATLMQALKLNYDMRILENKKRQLLYRRFTLSSFQELFPAGAALGADCKVENSWISPAQPANQPVSLNVRIVQDGYFFTAVIADDVIADGEVSFVGSMNAPTQYSISLPTVSLEVDAKTAQIISAKIRGQRLDNPKEWGDFECVKELKQLSVQIK